jgi:hypothetical protein
MASSVAPSEKKAKSEPEKPGREEALGRQRALGRQLRAMFNEVQTEPVPQAFMDLLDELERRGDENPDDEA